MPRINIAQFRKEILQDNDGKLNRAALALANERFDEAHEELLAEFNSDDITREIEAGPESENISGTIDDPNTEETGNLYSFIGFEGNEGFDQITELREQLEDHVVLKNLQQKTMDGSIIKFQFGVFVPPEGELIRLTPMPWGDGSSWLKGMERGISGIAYYIYRSIGIAKSRSGTAVQSKGQNPYRKDASFRPKEYLLTMLNKFVKSFN